MAVTSLWKGGDDAALGSQATGGPSLAPSPTHRLCRSRHWRETRCSGGPASSSLLLTVPRPEGRLVLPEDVQGIWTTKAATMNTKYCDPKNYPAHRTPARQHFPCARHHARGANGSIIVLFRDPAQGGTGILFYRWGHGGGKKLSGGSSLVAWWLGSGAFIAETEFSS